MIFNFPAHEFRTHDTRPFWAHVLETNLISLLNSSFMYSRAAGVQHDLHRNAGCDDVSGRCAR